ncbi:MAG TPA: DUF4105 domain-containing protein [Tepidisphaeraceae bacterium]|nr:DUF4105 domain-containing protein [Tepidisphaeraceae bacterium]
MNLIFLLAMQIAAPASGPGAPPTAYIITIGPGDQSWEKFGHNMLEIRHASDKYDDVAFNWGIFDFEAPNFYLNFLRGRLWYSMGGTTEAQKVIDGYRDADRTIWEQELNLSPAQVQALMDYCIWNSQKENREYRYDYFRDNCSTRVRDAVDKALGGQIEKRAATQPSNLTFRSETNRLMADDPFLYIALNYVLGHPTDRKLSAWDEMFIPMRFREQINEISITDESGREVPLVRNEIVLNASKHVFVREEPPNWVGWFTLAGTMLGGAIAACGLALSRWRSKGLNRSIMKNRLIRWGFIGLATAWSFLAGFAGWFVIYAWTCTDHAATHPNENVLQFSPLAMPLIVLWPFVLRGWSKPAKAAWVLTALMLGCSILGLFLKLLPMMNQINGNMIALALPANAGLAWAAWALNPKRGLT